MKRIAVAGVEKSKVASSNQKKIEEWREEKSVIKTKSIRPDLID